MRLNAVLVAACAFALQDATAAIDGPYKFLSEIPVGGEGGDKQALPPVEAGGEQRRVRPLAGHYAFDVGGLERGCIRRMDGHVPLG